MPWKATHRYARISPRKARLVADMIRGLRASEALDTLMFTHKRAARLLEKVVRSALASADNQDANLRDLVISAAYVDEGPTMKRFQPKDRGRAHPILKRTSHITVQVDTQ